MKSWILKVHLKPGKLNYRCHFSLFFNGKNTDLIAWCSFLTPQELPCCPPLTRRRSSVINSRSLSAVFWQQKECCSRVSHGCRKPFQGQAKGVGGGSLIKPGFRTSSAVFQHQGIWLLRSWGLGNGAALLKSTKAKSLGGLSCFSLYFGPVMLHKVALHKAQPMQSGLGGRGKHVTKPDVVCHSRGKHPKDVRNKNFQVGSWYGALLTASAWHRLFFPNV